MPWYYEESLIMGVGRRSQGHCMPDCKCKTGVLKGKHGEPRLSQALPYTLL